MTILPETPQGIWANNLSLIVKRGLWTLSSHWGEKAASADKYEEGKRSVELAPAECDVWCDWVMRIRWSHRADGLGLIDIWKDDRHVCRIEGPNTYNQRIGHNFNLGIKVDAWYPTRLAREPSDVDVRSVLLDEVRIGNEASTYQDVSPSGVALDYRNHHNHSTPKFINATSAYDDSRF